jgi:hypothetical protein
LTPSASPSGGFGAGATTSPGNPNAGSPSFGAQVFGGGPIIGVASMVDKTGMHEFNAKSNYKDWLFIYDPQRDRGGLIKGPYNPNAFVGTGGGPGRPIGTPAGSGLPNIPGVSTPGGVFGGSPQPSQPTTPNP